MKIKTRCAKRDIKDLLYNNWVQKAKSTMYYIETLGCDLNCVANIWGGCFSDLPDDLSYQDVKDIIEAHEEIRE